MRNFYKLFLLLNFCAVIHITAQQQESGIIEGRIANSASNEPIPFANLVIYGTNIGSVSDLDGKFLFTGIRPGYVRIAASSVGFEQVITEEFLVTNANKAFIEILLEEKAVSIDEVVVKVSPFRKNIESPISLRRIGIGQIEKSAGGNRDVSKVIQSFPGVSSTPAYRNDVIVRGGGPGENRFYLDGVEIPNLNHFATQGASGGPVGIINVDFIREVNFYSGAFPVSTGNALSSVIDMKQIDGNKEKLKFKGAIGASDLALTLDGPITKSTTFIASARRSYLQFLFSALELPFLPTYNDFQFKVRSRIDEKNEVSIIALGAIDQFSLNLGANETPDQRYLLSYLPVNEQWNYTNGLVYKHFRRNGFDTWVLSRNYLNNVAYKHPDNDESLGRILDYSSSEIENKFRFERIIENLAGYKISMGAGGEYAKYLNNSYNQLFINNELLDLRYNTYIDMFHYGFFAQGSKAYFNKRLQLSLGLRGDGSSYSSEMNNPLKHLSPRLSASLKLTENIAWNSNTGRYYQRPAYTTMGYKDRDGNYVNRENGLGYIISDHFVTGLEYTAGSNAMVSVEGFFKNYSNYPYSVTDTIPLASKGADFGVVGNEEVISGAAGRSYGVEVLGQWQDLLGFNALLSYTFVRSEFRDLRSPSSGSYIPTSWDNRHLLNITASQTFRNNWYLGFKWRFVGGTPYTPYDPELSSVREAWDTRGGPYLDYSRFNKLRLKPYHQLDIRIDKQYFFRKWSLNFYVDVQNVYNYAADGPEELIRASFDNPDVNDVYTDAFGVERYDLETLKTENGGTILPTLGIIVEF